jgi:hypothetical protein
MAAKAGGKAKRAPAGSGMWLQGMICGGVLAFATPCALLGAVLMAPGVISLVVERGPHRPVTRAVSLACLSFTLAPLWHLFMDGQSMMAALEMLANPAVLCPAWLAGAVGWALCELLPMALRITAALRAKARIDALRAEETALRETWDLRG